MQLKTIFILVYSIEYSYLEEGILPGLLTYYYDFNMHKFGSCLKYPLIHTYIIMILIIGGNEVEKY